MSCPPLVFRFLGDVANEAVPGPEPAVAVVIKTARQRLCSQWSNVSADAPRAQERGAVLAPGGTRKRPTATSRALVLYVRDTASA
jgi:hypothetical protein